MNLHDLSINRSWTLFLDRDGVINRRIVGGYVTDWEEFAFLDGVLEAMRKFSSVFGKIIIVSNQQGIGKGLMTAEQLGSLHQKMLAEIEKTGGRVDMVFHSPYLEAEGHPDRKPGIGMAMRARQLFPEIEFSTSIMAGDSPSDIHFGKNAGMKTVFLGADVENVQVQPEADFYFKDLLSFANALTHQQNH